MKGREVRETLQGYTDPKIIHCIASVAEEISAMGQELNALVQLLDSITDVIAGLTDTMGQFKEIAEKMPQNKSKKLFKQ